MPRTTNSLVKQRNYVGDSIIATNNTQRIENRIVQENAESNSLRNTIEKIENNNILITGSNFYFLTYKDSLIDIYKSYRKGLEFYNRILCVETRFIDNDGKNGEKDDIISYSSNIYNNGITDVFNLIKNKFYGEDNKKSSIISLNLEKLYNYLFYNIYLPGTYTNIGEPDLNNVTDILNVNITKQIPIYINWGFITPKIMHYMKINNNNNFDDYLINFGPSYIDELFRLNLLVHNLKENIASLTIKSQASINQLTLDDTTIIYLIIDGNFYNNALRFFYNYANNLKIYNLLSTDFDESIKLKDGTNISLENINLVKQLVSDDPVNLYNLYLDTILDNGKEFSFSRPSNTNIEDNITSFPNVILINIPIAESVNDKNNSEFGKAVNKAFDLMKKYYFTKLTPQQQDKCYIYVKTDETLKSEQELIKTLINDSRLIPTEINSYNSYFLKEKKLILSSYNNIEYSLKNIQNINLSNIFNNLYILSSYDLEYNEELSSLSKFEEFVKGDSSKDLDYLIENYEYRKKNSIILEELDITSYQKIKLALLDSNFINYLLNKDIIDNYSGNFVSNDSNLPNKINGNNIYNIYKNIDIFYYGANNGELGLNNIYYINSIFEKLISKYIGENNEFLINNVGLNNFALKNNNFRIRNFAIYTLDEQYKFNIKKLGTGLDEFTIDKYIDVITDCDNFSSLISSIFYENIFLINYKFNILLNSATNIDLNNILDKTNSIISLITPDNLTFNDLFNNYPNSLKLKISSISSNLSLNLDGSIYDENSNNSLNTIDSINNFNVTITDSNSGTFNVILEIENIKNIYNNNNTFSLYSNLIEVTIN